MRKVGKNGRKVKAINVFAVFCPFMKNGNEVEPDLVRPEQCLARARMALALPLWGN
jgi:hypothetical protein